MNPKTCLSRSWFPLDICPTKVDVGLYYTTNCFYHVYTCKCIARLQQWDRFIILIDLTCRCHTWMQVQWSGVVYRPLEDLGKRRVTRNMGPVPNPQARLSLIY